GPQPVEALPPRFQIFGMQSEHVLLAAEIGLLRVAFGFPGEAISTELVGIGPGPNFHGPPLLQQDLALALDRPLTFVEELALAVELAVSQDDLLLRLFLTRLRQLLLAPEGVLRRLEFLHRALQVLLLEAMTVIEQNPLLLQVGFGLIVLGGEVAAQPLEFVLLPGPQGLERTRLVVAIVCQLVAFDTQAVPLAQQRFVQFLEFAFKLQARVGTLCERRFLAGDRELAL